jgi:hypothetical protein
MNVIHPVGPEEPRTYWVRRALVVAAVLIILALIVTLVVNAASTGSAVAANPSPAAPSPLVVQTSTPIETAAPTPSSTASESASASATRTAKASATAKAAGKATAKASGKTTAKASAKPSATPTKKAVPVACDPDKVRVTLNGKQHLKRKQKDKFEMSLINGGDQTCIAAVGPKNFELKIYSGKDRIWSSDDCSTAVRPINTKLKSQQAVAWTMTWNGRRSRDDCKNRPEIPRAGTYFATAQLKGAKPVQLRMIIRG